MQFNNISVENVVPKKKLKNPSPTNKWVRVIGGPEGVNLQILVEDCSKRPIFSKTEALEVAHQFLEQNPDPQPIPMKSKEKSSKYAIYTVGGKKIYIFIARHYRLDILILLPQNKMLEPIRTDDSSRIPSFYMYN